MAHKSGLAAKTVMVLASFFSFFSFAHAQVVTPRLEQLVKDTQSGIDLPTGGLPALQAISCQDLGTSGQIQEVTLSLESFGANVTAYVMGQGGWPVYGASAPVPVSSSQQDYVFTFSNPVDISTICSNPNGTVYLGLYSSDQHTRIYGSSSSDAYRDAAFDASNSSYGVKDWYFIINGVALVNHPPVLVPIADQTTSEGKMLSFNEPTVTDIDGGSFTITATNLPDGAMINGGILTWTPRFDQAGTYPLTFTITDDGNQGQFAPLSVSQTVNITVQDAVPNLHRLEQPVKDTQSGISIQTGSLPSLQAISCQDLQGQINDLTLSLDSIGNWNNVTAYIMGRDGWPIYDVSDTVAIQSAAQQDYTFTFRWPADVSAMCPTPDSIVYLGLYASEPNAHIYGSSSSYAYRDETFDASQSSYGVKDWYFIINPEVSSNVAPTLAPIGDRTVLEGQALQFTLSATDPDGDNLTYSAANLPPGATFDQATATFNWTPNYGQAGNYPNIEFTVTDNGTPIALDTQLITITVGHVNRAPVFAPTGPQAVLEGQPLTFGVSATDPDGDTVNLDAANLPAGSVFNAQTGTFTWTPVRSQIGNYVVTFSATDNGTPSLTSAIDVPITVGDNPTPVERSQDLVNAVVSYPFSTNLENSYLANLKKVSIFISTGKTAAAKQQLQAFVTKLGTDYTNGAITQAQYNSLLSQANALLAVL